MISLALNDQLIDLIKVPPGTFLQGAHDSLFGESPVRSVTIFRPFLLSHFPITRPQFQSVMGIDPSTFVHSSIAPVDSVSWEMAREFCTRTTESTSRTVRLPTESEWEYACRAGSSTDFHYSESGPFTDEHEIPQSVRFELCEYAWFDLNSRRMTNPIGEKRPNAWGFHDMIGNIWEWCEDIWRDDYVDAPCNGSAVKDTTRRSRFRCLRGGAWDMDAFRCRSSYRSFDDQSLVTPRFGFRIVIETH